MLHQADVFRKAGSGLRHAFLITEQRLKVLYAAVELPQGAVRKAVLFAVIPMEDAHNRVQSGQAVRILLRAQTMQIEHTVHLHVQTVHTAHLHAQAVRIVARQVHARQEVRMAEVRVRQEDADKQMLYNLSSK